MVKLTKDEVRLIARNKGIKNYQNMSREKLLSSLDKSERITEKLLQNGLEQIAKMQNLSLNKLEQIERLNNLSFNKLEQIAKTRRIKNYRDMSKEDLLIALLKSNQSHVELRRSEGNNAEIKEIKRIFNKFRNNFSKEEIKKIRTKFYFREAINEYLEELEEKDSFTMEKKREKKCYTKKLQKIKEFLKKLKEDLNRLENYQYNDNEDLDYRRIRQVENLFDKINKDYCKPIKTIGAFNDSYMEYESRGDRDTNLSLEDYLNIIKSLSEDMINNHKTHGEWKIQLTMRIIFVSSLDTNEFRIMHTQSNNATIMSGT